MSVGQRAALIEQWFRQPIDCLALCPGRAPETICDECWRRAASRERRIVLRIVSTVRMYRVYDGTRMAGVGTFSMNCRQLASCALVCVVGHGCSKASSRIRDQRGIAVISAVSGVGRLVLVGLRYHAKVLVSSRSDALFTSAETFLRERPLFGCSRGVAVVERQTLFDGRGPRLSVLVHFRGGSEADNPAVSEPRGSPTPEFIWGSVKRIIAICPFRPDVPVLVRERLAGARRKASPPP